MATLREVVAVLDGLYDPAWADDWDAVGTIVGDPDAEITSILFAVDPVAEVVAEAIETGAQLIVTHHPLYLKGTTTVAASTPKGRVVHELIANGIALHNCHTNADGAPLGVSESMALALGLTDLRPLEVDVATAVDKWVVFVPNDYADQVSTAMHVRSVPTIRLSSAALVKGPSGHWLARCRQSVQSATLSGLTKPGSNSSPTRSFENPSLPQCSTPTHTKRWPTTCGSWRPGQAAEELAGLAGWQNQ